MNLHAKSGTQRTTAVAKTFGEFLTPTEESWISADYEDTELYSTLQGLPYICYIAYYVEEIKILYCLPSTLKFHYSRTIYVSLCNRYQTLKLLEYLNCFW